VTGSGDDQAIEVEIECGRVAEYTSVNVSVRQAAGLELVSAYGFTQIPFCDGTHVVAIPLTSNDGVLVGGPARVSVTATVHGYQPPDFFYDTATASDTVRLSGQLAAEFFDPVPNPGSRISIDEVTRTSISGTVECEEPVMVQLDAYAVQRRGRSMDGAYGYASLDCDGTTPFVVDIAMYGDGLQGGGTAAVQVYGSAYVIVERPGYIDYEYRWSDVQQASVRVRGR
jgi:hypothetical protein